MGYAFRKGGRTYVATGDLIMPGGRAGLFRQPGFQCPRRAGQPEEAGRAAARRGAGRARRGRSGQFHRRRHRGRRGHRLVEDDAPQAQPLLPLHAEELPRGGLVGADSCGGLRRRGRRRPARRGRAGAQGQGRGGEDLPEPGRPVRPVARRRGGPARSGRSLETPPRSFWQRQGAGFLRVQRGPGPPPPPAGPAAVQGRAAAGYPRVAGGRRRFPGRRQPGPADRLAICCGLLPGPAAGRRRLPGAARASSPRNRTWISHWPTSTATSART